jgi:hypothetical protein
MDVEGDDARWRAGRPMWPLVGARAHNDRPRVKRAAGGLQREAGAVRRLEGRHGDTLTDGSAERAGPALEVPDDLVLAHEPVRVVAGVRAAR